VALSPARAALLRTLTCAALAASCGPRRGPAPGAPRQGEAVRLDPIHVTASREGERLSVDAYDARELFARGSQALRGGAFEEAVRLYASLLAEFPDSFLVEPALYNQGLCYDALSRFGEAAGAYGDLVARFPDSPDVEDALFRLAGSHERLEDFDGAVGALDALLARPDLDGIERIEALARKGAALIPLGRTDDARLALTEATRLYRQGRGISPSDSVFYYSMAEFKLGEIVHDEMRGVALPPDDQILEAQLERKAELLLEAQRRYTSVIRIGDPHWAAAAAYRIGALYHHLWKDILAAPPPGELDEEARAIYVEILRDRTRVLLEKAVLQWERTLKLARRLRLDNEWVDSTTRDLAEIREELEIEKGEGMDEMDGTDGTDGGKKR
jgi:tetratricopeptide (TPR) repeat protein